MMDEKIVTAEFNRRIFQESIPRIEKCLSLLSPDQIWKAPNEHTNSIGNLILHLCGNVEQWIGSGIGGLDDHRTRQWEFDNREQFSANNLIKRLRDLRQLTDVSLSTLNGQKLSTTHRVQGFEESGYSIIVHVIEHFSYHTGQIALLTKLWINDDLGFYAGSDLNITS